MYFQVFLILFLLAKSHRRTITERSLHQGNGNQSGSTGETQENYGVCLFCHSRLLVKHWSINYAKNFLSYMNKVLIPSILRQCESHSSCPSMRSFYLLIKVDQHHDELEKFIWRTGKLINLRVYTDPTAYHEIIHKIVDWDDCKWLSSIYIDADNSLLNGYFDYVLSKLIGKLEQTVTTDGLPWRGALFGARTLSHLIIGKGRCGIEDVDEYWYSGHSQGQGFLLRRDVWEKSGRFSEIRGLHNRFLQKLRNYIMRGLGFKDWESKCCQGWARFWNETDERQIALENEEAASSRIMFFDMSLVKSTGAMFIVTPFSSHFPWNTWQDLPVCRDEERRAIQGKFPKSIGNILNTVNSGYLNITLQEACTSNIFLSSALPSCKPLIDPK